MNAINNFKHADAIRAAHQLKANVEAGTTPAEGAYRQPASAASPPQPPPTAASGGARGAGGTHGRRRISMIAVRESNWTPAQKEVSELFEQLELTKYADRVLNDEGFDSLSSLKELLVTTGGAFHYHALPRMLRAAAAAAAAAAASFRL